MLECDFWFDFDFCGGGNTPYFHPSKIPKQFRKRRPDLGFQIWFWFLWGWKYAVFSPPKNSKSNLKMRELTMVFGFDFVFWGGRNTPYFHPPKTRNQIEKICAFHLFQCSWGRHKARIFTYLCHKIKKKHKKIKLRWARRDTIIIFLPIFDPRSNPSVTTRITNSHRPHRPIRLLQFRISCKISQIFVAFHMTEQSEVPRAAPLPPDIPVCCMLHAEELPCLMPAQAEDDQWRRLSTASYQAR